MSARARGAVLAIVFAGVAAVAASAYYLWITLPPTSGLLGMGQNSSIFSLARELPAHVPAASIAGLRVAILADDRNVRVTPPGFYRDEVDRWRRWLIELGGVIAPPAVAEVLVLPHAACLSPQHRAMVQRQLARGRGVIASGPLGARTADCSERADTLLLDLLGAPPGSVRTLDLAGRSGSVYGVILGETTLGAGIPPGARFELRPADQLVFRGAERHVFYTDFFRNPVRQRGEPFFDGAIVRASADSGRIAAFGFALTHAVPGWSETLLRAVVANAVLWAAGRTIPHLAPWPNGAAAAAVLAQEVEHEPEHAAAAAARLAAIDAPASFFVLGDQAAASPAAVRRIAAAAELGIHAVDILPLADLPATRLRRLFTLARQQVQTAAGSPLHGGLRLPEQRFDQATLQAWRDVGGEYAIGVNNGRAAAPELIPLDDGETMVLLPRVVHDDYHWIGAEGLRDRAEISARFLEQLEEIIAYRGLFLLGHHSHLLARPALLPVLTAVATATRDDPRVWLASARDAADWWTARAAVRLALTPDMDAVIATNTAPQPLPGATLLLDLPSGEQRRIPLDTLPPGSETRIALDTLTPGTDTRIPMQNEPEPAPAPETPETQR